MSENSLQLQTWVLRLQMCAHDGGSAGWPCFLCRTEVQDQRRQHYAAHYQQGFVEPQVCHLPVPEICLSKQASISPQLQAALPALPAGQGPGAEELRQRIGEKHQQMHGFTSAEDELRDARKDLEENLKELKGVLHGSGWP